ncbi:gamma-glutamyl hydrolase B-like isoform X2 [Hydractinia symbiolongicarpus]|nr:gamma-glutamyl hydrolase B-like isoform X2 [Hydractinia symbiolongicarpus]XP_057315895.1 gamma-glutamyl hydrolase B-like isoform X2 [Hydractinia symbiolongicarpus]
MNSAIFVLVVLVDVTFCRPPQPSETLNYKPTVAILAQLVEGQSNSYIAASYVKYLESAGARAVLIPTSLTDEQVTELFSYVNGVLFPGGGVQWFTSQYYKHAKIFYDHAIQANKGGDYFPIWGTCLGFETLHVLTTNSGAVLSPFAADDISIPLNFTENAASSRLFKDVPPNIYKAMETEKVTYNHHSYGISPNAYNKYPALSRFFKILSTNYDLVGKEFVSMVEARDYPIYGGQWHPEKNNFEFSDEIHAPHTTSAVLVSQAMANFFVSEARKSKHKFPTEEIASKYLSYNYNTTYTGKTEGNLKHFEEVYLFPL